MAASRRSPGRVTTVPLTAIGSGARTADLFPVPLPIFLTARIAMWLLRRWYGLGVLYFFTYEDSWWLTILFILFAMCIPFGYMWFSNRKGNHKPLTVIRATWYWMKARRRWRKACNRIEINEGPKIPKLTRWFPWSPPRIENEHGTALSFLVDVSRTGATVSDIEDGREQLTGSLKARRVRILRTAPGVARITFEWDANLNRSAVANPRDRIRSTQLPMAELDHNVWLELDTSVLVVGESGSGKSNLTWNILNRLNDYGIPYRLYVIDPKKVELAELVDSPNTVRYTDEPMKVHVVIKEFYDAMMNTFTWMKENRLRSVDISEQNPLKILVIDELLMCGDEVKGDVTKTNLGQVLISGRAAGYIVIGNSQLGQVDVLGRIRDLFPQRICMAVKSGDLTNAVLGPKAEERGARCTEITEKGVGYIFTDFSGTFLRFRPPFIEDITTVAQGRYYDPSPVEPTKRGNRFRNRKCYTYELYGWYCMGVRCFYVGKGFNPNDRIRSHQREKPWMSQVDMSRTVINRWPDEETALREETRLIEELKPIYNIVGNHNT